MLQHFEILGTGGYLPGEPVTAIEVESREGLPSGWIAQHTQVETRFACRTPETLVTMAKEAIHLALDDAKVSWGQIDLIIDCSTSRHQPIPCNGAMIHSLFETETNGIPAMDVHGSCLGFILGLNVANSFFASGLHQRIMLVTSESTLAAANWSDPESATLLGDGAAAVVVGRREPKETFSFQQETYSQHINDCQVLGGGHSLPGYEYTKENDHAFRFDMDGPKLMKTAIKYLPPMVNQLIEQTEVSRQELLTIPHQASPRAVELVRRRLKMTPENFIDRTRDLGNMAAASIPFILNQLRQEGQLAESRPCMLLGTSSGYSQAGLIFQS